MIAVVRTIVLTLDRTQLNNTRRYATVRYETGISYEIYDCVAPKISEPCTARCITVRYATQPHSTRRHVTLLPRYKRTMIAMAQLLQVGPRTVLDRTAGHRTLHDYTLLYPILLT